MIFYDVRVWETWCSFPVAFMGAYGQWLNDHGIDNMATYRTEHHVIDAPLVRVFQYAKDENGHSYIDPATDDIARRDPFDVLIKIPPPTPRDFC